MKQNIGIEINMKDNERIVMIEPEPKLKEFLKSQTEKNYTYYLTEFIGGEKNYQIAYKAVEDAMEKSLPDDIKDRCAYCKDEGDEVGDKACGKYILQMQLTFMIASSEFINLIFRNRFIYDDKPKLQKLTIKFFDCLRFIKNEGKMYFELDKMCRYTLSSGFLTLSQMFAKSDTLKSYQIINNTLNDIHEKEVQNKVLQNEDEDYLDLQKEFFEGKLRYYREKIYIEEKEKPKSLNKKKEVKLTSIPQYALYYYYLQQSGDFGYFENHPNGKISAIAELIEKEDLKTTTKYFQKVYNKIAHYTTNRIAKNQVANIDFVANTMLNGFPNAKKIALKELKEARTKQR